MILKASFRLPTDFLARFNYQGERRFVALYWEPCGDEAAYDDGISSAIGLSDNWLYLDFIRQPDVRRWLDKNGIHLGNRDEEARHWLIVDAATNEVYTAPRSEAFRILRTQAIPVEPNPSPPSSD
jgi:hypothetical protein